MDLSRLFNGGWVHGISRLLVVGGYLHVAILWWLRRRRDWREPVYLWVVGMALGWAALVAFVTLHGVTPVLSTLTRVWHYPTIVAFILILTYRKDVR